MKKRHRTKGLNLANAMIASRAIGQELSKPVNTPITARCDKCGGALRAAPALLSAIRMGVVDHAGCGGTFRAVRSAVVGVEGGQDG